MADNQNPWLGYPLDNHIIFLISNAGSMYNRTKYPFFLLIGGHPSISDFFGRT